jgi:uncharacterized protein DUF6916
MKSTRRLFLTGAGTVVAAAAASSLSIGPTAEARDTRGGPKGPDAKLLDRPQSEFVSQAMWNQDTFQPFVNTDFRVADGQGSGMVLRLMSVEDLRSQNLQSVTAFALHFQFVSGTVLQQGTYIFSNPPLGKFLLFVVTAGASSNASYVAVINRL